MKKEKGLMKRQGKKRTEKKAEQKWQKKKD